MLDNVIGNGLFSDFLKTFEKKHRQRERMRFFLQKMAFSDMSWDEFNRKLDAEEGIVDVDKPSDEELAEIVKHSFKLGKGVSNGSF